VTWDAHHLVGGSDVIDGLDESGIIDSEGVSRQQARRVEADKAQAVAGANPDQKAVAVEFRLVIFVVGDDGGLIAAGGNHDGGASRGLGGTLVATTGEVTAAVPQEYVVELRAGAVGDAFDLT
jgi:hypothetical protein